MKIISIKNHKNDRTIYSGHFKTMRHAIETAIFEQVSLACADLRKAKLANATLDGGDFRNALLEGADLQGANMSEADISHASLRGADLTLACLCEALMQDTDLSAASFGATLIGSASIDNCIFSCPSALTLPFAEAQAGRNIYVHGDKVHLFTGAPVVITGLPKRVVFLDSAILIGDTAYPRDNIPVSLLKELETICAAAAC